MTETLKDLIREIETLPRYTMFNGPAGYLHGLHQRPDGMYVSFADVVALLRSSALAVIARPAQEESAAELYQRWIAAEARESRSPDGDGPAVSDSSGMTDGPHGPLPVARWRTDARSATPGRFVAGSEPADSLSTSALAGIAHPSLHCAECDLTWSGPYTDCPGCLASGAMKAIRDLQAPPSLQEQGWQPIETAPKDGRSILTVVATFKDCVPSVSQWVTFEGESRWGLDPEVFCEDDHFREHWSATRYDPTHWMPLPLPPPSAKG